MAVPSFSAGDPVACLTRGIANARTGALKVDGTTVAITGGTYSLELVSGTVVQTGTVASGGAITGGITPAADAAVGAARERWSVTTATASYVFTVPAIISQITIACPVESGTITATAPALSTYPGSQTSWWTQIAVAWGLVLLRVRSSTLMGTADIWDTGVLLPVTLEAALAHCYEAAAGYGAEPYVSLAQMHRVMYDEEWERLTLQLNTDSDAAVESVVEPVRAGQVSTPAGRA